MFVAIVDTNAMLHYPPLSKVDWCKLCDVESVVLMMCLPVVKELDKHKSDPRHADRARERLKEIEDNIGKEIVPNVRIEFFDAALKSADFPETLSHEVYDDQIVHLAVKCREQGNDVVVITEDTGMKLRCRGHAIKVIKQPSQVASRCSRRYQSSAQASCTTAR